MINVIGPVFAAAQVIPNFIPSRSPPGGRLGSTVAVTLSPVPPTEVSGNAEASYSQAGGEDSTRLMAQGGYSLGRVLPYLTLGHDFSNSATVFGAGIDVALTRRLLGGLAYTKADDAERIEARVGWRF